MLNSTVRTQVTSLFALALVAGFGVGGCATEVPDPDEDVTESSADALSDSDVSRGYNCAAAGVTAAVGAGGAVSCGLATLPSGGAAALCYFVGVGTAAAGSLAYCGSQCPGFRSVCPGYKPASFRETSRLVSRCVGTARYSHWEQTDPALIRQYGRSRPEYRDGDCSCPRGRSCPTP